MKKLLLLFAFAFLSIGITQAQENKVPAKLTASILQQLELSDEQEENITKITSRLQFRSDVIQTSDISAESKKASRMSYADRERANMKNFLTKDQYKKYLKLTGRKEPSKKNKL